MINKPKMATLVQLQNNKYTDSEEVAFLEQEIFCQIVAKARYSHGPQIK